MAVIGQLSASVFTSKIARRTLVLFFLSALIPILLFSYLAWHQVSSVLQAQQQKELQRTAKNFGLLLYERLSFLRQEALNNRDKFERWSSNSDAMELDLIEDRLFEDLLLVDLSIEPLKPLIAERFSFEVEEFSTGGLEQASVLIDSKDQSVWLAVVFGDKNQNLLFLKPVQGLIWSGLADYDLTKQFTVYSHSQEVLFTSKSVVGLQALRQQSNQSAHWFLVQPSLANDLRWDIEAVLISSQSLLNHLEFKQLLRSVTLLAVLLAAFVGVNTIRRSLQPIEALRTAIEKIKNKHYGQLVTIKSDDEFELLGNAFNHMSVKLEQNINALKSLSAIDQLILNRLSIEDIAQLVITEGRDLLGAEVVHFLMCEQAQDRCVAFSNIYQKQNLPLSEATLGSLFDGNKISCLSPNNLPRVVTDLVKGDGFIYSVVLPCDGSVAAGLLVEFSLPPNDSLVDVAYSFVNHIAVALNNADWQKRLYQQANYDALTSLPNRYRFNTDLSSALEQANVSQDKIALYIIDIDEFKSVNDAFGHAAGDALLKIIAQRLSHHVGTESIYRLGGDEFVVLHSCAEKDRRKLVAETSSIAESLRAAVVQPVLANQQQMDSTISIGIAFFPDDGKSAEELLRLADKAMYQSKALGKNRYQYYSEIYRDSANEQWQVVAELRRALAKDEFVLFYQAKVDLSSGRVAGCEALIRWQHPERGLLVPYAFIPQAEAYGVIEDIGRWVIRAAAKQQKVWLQAGLDIGRIAINISVQQLHNPSFYSDVKQIFEDVGVAGSCFEFEITETAYVEDFEYFSQALKQLKQLDLVFSIDDYGTGYSSLSRLLNVPVNKIKIDKSFVDNIETDPVSYAIVESTINLAKAMSIQIIAEGIETTGQLERLQQTGCQIGQGYLFSKPVSAQEFVSSVGNMSCGLITG